MTEFTPHSQVQGHIPPNYKLDILLEDADRTLALLEGESSCHAAVAMWMERVGEGEPVRGHFYPCFEHSWIDMGTWILDLYPVGGARPHVVARDVGRHLYLPWVTRIIEHPTSTVEGKTLSVTQIGYRVTDEEWEEFELTSPFLQHVDPQTETITYSDLCNTGP